MYIVFAIYHKFYDSNKEFCKKLWIQNWEQRYVFVQNIIKSELLIGLSKKEVVQLLGDEFNGVHSLEWIYYVGKPSYFFLFQKQRLKINFNNKNEVCSVHL